ncbi:hypothetical protein HZH68_002915 [Vespula germanica]|uniref:Uncharacterized protein n=1 Tax=Vespula germanica TaxID=30212 RepID=A0A834NN47_VESGE|nr:hypothetical protein HZH68_002915 [Vespula germanica]
MARARRRLTAAIAVAFAAIVKSSATAIVRYFDNGSSIKAILKQYENDELIKEADNSYILSKTSTTMLLRQSDIVVLILTVEILETLHPFECIGENIALTKITITAKLINIIQRTEISLKI